MDARLPEGPQPQPLRLTCAGCRHLETTRWEEYLENDERDSGTSANCTKAGRNITAYWISAYTPPDWCPCQPPDYAAEMRAITDALAHMWALDVAMCAETGAGMPDEAVLNRAALAVARFGLALLPQAGKGGGA